MRFKIGEVSKILNISDQMIRYYEKEGVISPKREGDGKYRTYSTMDVFLIYEAMKYKEWNINLKEINSIVNNDYFNVMVQKIDNFSKHLESTIKKEELLLKRINSVKEKLNICQYNINNYWIEKAPCRYCYYSNKAVGDNHLLISMDKDIQKIVFDKQTISFFDVMVTFKNGYEEWSYSIDDFYHDNLYIEDNEKYTIIPSQLCLSTIVDMGQEGMFNNSCLDNILSYMKNRGYKQSGEIYGIIIGRGKKENFTRLLQIFVPIETL